MIEQNRFDQNERPWGVYDEGLARLDCIFDVTSEGGLSKFTRKRGRFGQPVFALHLLGGTKSLRDLPRLTGGVAVTLNDFRSGDIRLSDDQKRIELVAEDVLTEKAWAKVTQYLTNQRCPGFDLIYSSPLLGWDVIGLQPEAIWLLLDLAWRVLAEEGVIFLETIREQSVSRDMLIFFLQQNKIDIQEKERIIVLKKKKGDPDRLPKIGYGK